MPRKKRVPKSAKPQKVSINARGRPLSEFGCIRRTNLIPTLGGGPISKNDIPLSSYAGLGTRPGQVGYWSRMDESGFG